MLKDITLGQYFPGNTVLHRLDPRAKLVITVLYIAALFLAKGYASYGVTFLFLAVSVLLSGVKASVLLKSLKPLIILVAITGFLNIFFTAGEPLVSFWIFTVTKEGLINAAYMMARILMLVAGTFLLTYTTSPMMLTDGLESLMGPLKRVGAPVHELSMMMNTALRFIPDLMEETDTIMRAQKARGADFETGSLMRRAKAMLPLLVPLFVGAFRRADELAVAMESRCYRGGEGRTRMKRMELRGRDAAALCAACALLAVILILRRIGL